MTTDDRNLPLELRIPLGTVVDASTPPSMVARNPGPSALTGASPGLGTAAPTPLASPTLPDPSDPQTMTLLIAKVAAEMFGGSSIVPAESPASIVGSPHGLRAPGSPGFSPTLVPGPAPAGADLSNPINATIPSGSAPSGSTPSGAPGFSATPIDAPGSSSAGIGGVPTSPTASGSAPHGSAPYGAAPYGSTPELGLISATPGMGAPGITQFGGVPGAPHGTNPGVPSTPTAPTFDASPFSASPSFSNVGGMPPMASTATTSRDQVPASSSYPGGTPNPASSNPVQPHGESPHSGYGDAPTYGGAAPGYGGGSPAHGARSTSAQRDSGSSSQREGVPSSATQFAGGSQVQPAEGGHSPTTVMPHGTPPPALTPAYSGGAPSAPPGVMHEAPKPSVPSTRHATGPIGESPFGSSALDLGKLGLSPFGTSPQSITSTQAPLSAGEAAEPFGDSPIGDAPVEVISSSSPFGDAPMDLSSIGLSPYGRAPTEGMTLPIVDAMPAGTGPYFMPPANALGIDMGEPRIAAHDVRPGGDDRLVRDLGTNAFDPYRVRKDFPILEERVHGGKRLVWLDNAATTQKPRAVIDRISYFYAHENSNVHRAAHALAARATDAYENARESVRRFINAPSTKEIVWCRGATEGINLIAQSWGRRHVGKGDEIVITHLEHHANIVPWQMLCAEKGARLRVAPVDDRGDVILEEYEKLMGPRTRLVAIPQVSNALGTITPTREMVAIAHRYGAKVLVDGAQSVSHMRVDVQALDCEWFVFSGHKVFAPTGIGAVYGKREILEASPPWQGGGNMIEDVTFERTRYNPPPSRFEAGTGSIGDAVGLGAALDYVSKIGIETIDRYEHDLLVYGTRRLATVPGLTMIGTSKHKAGVLSFTLAGQRTEDISAELDKEGIAVRSGHHCAQPILRRFGVEATVRASLAFYNVCEDIDALVEALHRLQAARR